MRRGSEGGRGAGAREGQGQPPGNTGLGSQGAWLSHGLPSCPPGPPPTARKAPCLPRDRSFHTLGFWRQKLTGPPGWVRTQRPPPCFSGTMGRLWASEYSGNTTLAFLQQLLAKTPQLPRPTRGQMCKEPRGCQGHREKLRLGWGEWSESRPGICPQSCPAGTPLQLHSWSVHSPLPSRRALRAALGPGSAAGREGRRTRG